MAFKEEIEDERVIWWVLEFEVEFKEEEEEEQVIWRSGVGGRGGVHRGGGGG